VVAVSLPVAEISGDTTGSSTHWLTFVLRLVVV